MNKLKKSLFFDSLSSVIFIIFGIYLIYSREKAYNLTAIILSIVLLIISLHGLFRFFTREEKNKGYGHLAYGLITLALGIFFLISRKSIVPITPILFGIYMLVNATFKVVSIKNMKRMNNKNWTLGVLILFFMFSLGFLSVLSFLIDVLLIEEKVMFFLTTYSILNIILSYLYTITYKEKEIVVYEATVVEGE